MGLTKGSLAFVLFRHPKLKTSLGGAGGGGTYTTHTGMCRPIAGFLLHKTKLNARLALRQRAFWSENRYTETLLGWFYSGNIYFSFTNISEGTTFLQGLTYDNIGKSWLDPLLGSGPSFLEVGPCFQNWIDFAQFGLASYMVFKGTTGLYRTYCTLQFQMSKKEKRNKRPEVDFTKSFLLLF